MKRGKIPLAPDARFESFVMRIPESGCWIWLGALDWDGYGVFSPGVEFSKRKTIGAHRWSYQNFRGEIPDGFQIDHLCRVRCCVNPHHLEAVTPRENVIRGILPSTRKEFWANRKHCRNHLHEMTPDNVEYDSAGCRRCKRCRMKTQENNNRRRNIRRAKARLAINRPE